VGKIEPISKIGKWFEVKPPARRAYAPEGKARGSEESRPVVGILLMKKPIRLFQVIAGIYINILRIPIQA